MSIGHYLHVTPETECEIERYLPTVKQRLGTIGQMNPARRRTIGEWHEKLAEEMVRMAYRDDPIDRVSNCITVPLNSYCTETDKRLHENGIIGLEIYVPVRSAMFLDNRVPVSSITLRFGGIKIATAEMCMGEYGQIYAIFSKESIPISTHILSKWSITMIDAHKGFNWDELEIYWVFGELPPPVPKFNLRYKYQYINLFLYGNTNWSDEPPFQHRGGLLPLGEGDQVEGNVDQIEDKDKGEGGLGGRSSPLYTNHLILDEHGDVVGIGISH